jgi:branched-chain amino acid aminotransferase
MRLKALNESDLRFGTVFTDQMLLAEYDSDPGWHRYRIEPYGPLQLDPATAGLHYGQSIFDGLKAFRGDDGQVRLFRPEKHIERISNSARRLSMPALDPSTAMSWLLEFVRSQEEWVPSMPRTSLYLRPAMLATEAFLGVRPALSYLFFVIACPVGNYYADQRPLKILIEDRYGNYAASLLAAEEAHTLGFDQVLWLDGAQRQFLEEVGTMNVMLRIGDEVLTPPLGGTILAGVIRDSALTLLTEWGIAVSERPISVDELISACRQGTLKEAWGTGTAAAVMPIGEFGYKTQRLVIGDGRPGEVARRLSEGLMAIQHGRVPDSHAWTVQVPS